VVVTRWQVLGLIGGLLLASVVATVGLAAFLVPQGTFERPVEEAADDEAGETVDLLYQVKNLAGKGADGAEIETSQAKLGMLVPSHGEVEDKVFDTEYHANDVAKGKDEIRFVATWDGPAGTVSTRLGESKAKIKVDQKWRLRIDWDHVLFFDDGIRADLVVDWDGTFTVDADGVLRGKGTGLFLKDWTPWNIQIRVPFGFNLAGEHDPATGQFTFGLGPAGHGFSRAGPSCSALFGPDEVCEYATGPAMAPIWAALGQRLLHVGPVDLPPGSHQVPMVAAPPLTVVIEPVDGS
jgi:hypothetical protein